MSLDDFSKALDRESSREQCAKRRALLEPIAKPYSGTAFYPVPMEVQPWVSYVFVSRGTAESGAHDFSWLPDAGAYLAVFTSQVGTGAPLGSAGCGAFLICGPHLRRHVIPSAGGESIGVALRPGGAHVLLGRPMSAVANAIVDAREIWGCWANEVLERVASRVSTRARVELLLSLLRSRVNAGPDRFMDELLQRAGHPSVELSLRALAMGAGYSERHLRRKFAEQLGIGPKELLRIVRVNATVTSERWREHGWADHAVRSGYCDQSHLIGEFRALLGQPPEKFLQMVIEPRLLAARLVITQKPRVQAPTP